MAETLPKLTSSHVGYRVHLNKVKDIMKKEPPTEIDAVSLNSIFEQLTRKKSILNGLDEKIAALIEEPKDLEQEIFEMEEIHDEILDTTSQISKFIHLTLTFLLRNLLLSLLPPHIRNPHKWFTMKSHSCQATCQIPALQALKKMHHPLVKQPLGKLLTICTILNLS